MEWMAWLGSVLSRLWPIVTWLFLAGDVALSLLAFVLAGSLVGCLVFNWHPAPVFIGNSGSLIIGAIIAVLAIKVIDHDTSRLPIYLKQRPTPIFAMAVIAYPLVDTLHISYYRMVRGVSPFAGFAIISITGSWT